MPSKNVFSAVIAINKNRGGVGLEFNGGRMISLRSNVLTLFILLAGFASVRGAEFSVGAKYFFVTGNRVRVRQSPSLNSKPIGVINKWDVVRVEKISPAIQEIDGLKSSWYEVQIATLSKGWAFGGYLHELPRVLDNNSPLYDTSLLNIQIGTVSANEPICVMDVSRTPSRPYKGRFSDPYVCKVRTLAGTQGWLELNRIEFSEGLNNLYPVFPEADDGMSGNTVKIDKSFLTYFFRGTENELSYINGRFKPEQNVYLIHRSTGGFCEGVTKDSYICCANPGSYLGKIVTRVALNKDCSKGDEDSLALVGPKLAWHPLSHTPVTDKKLISKLRAISAPASPLTENVVSLPKIVRYEIPKHVVYLADYQLEDSWPVPVFVIDGKPQATEDYEVANIISATQIGNRCFVEMEYGSYRAGEPSTGVWELESSGEFRKTELVPEYLIVQ